MLIPLTIQADLLMIRLVAARQRGNANDEFVALDTIRTLATPRGFYVSEGAPYGLDLPGFYRWLNEEVKCEDLLPMLAA